MDYGLWIIGRKTTTSVAAAVCAVDVSIGILYRLGFGRETTASLLRAEAGRIRVIFFSLGLRPRLFELKRGADRQVAVDAAGRDGGATPDAHARTRARARTHAHTHAHTHTHTHTHSATPDATRTRARPYAHTNCCYTGPRGQHTPAKATRQDTAGQVTEEARVCAHAHAHAQIRARTPRGLPTRG